jgi:membrane protease subunit HflC
MNRIGMIAVGALVALMVAASTMFIVDQRQVAVVFALGEIKEVITEPGLKFKPRTGRSSPPRRRAW